jgi:hypothetical protein
MEKNYSADSSGCNSSKNDSNDPILVLKNSPQYKEANVTKFINDESFLKKIEFLKAKIT